MRREDGNIETSVSKNNSPRTKPAPNWDDIRVFGAVARAGSLRGASQSLNLQVPTISKRLDSLETVLGLKLFERTPRGMVLTAPGRRVASGADSIEMLVQQTVSSIHTSRDIDGEVRLLMPDGPADRWFIPNFLKLFMQRHPDLALRLGTSSGTRDTAAPAFDVQIQYAPATQSGLSTVRIGKLHFLFFATEDYLASFGAPLSEQDFADHRFADATPSLDAQNGFMATYSNIDAYGHPSLISNSGLVVANAVQAGAVMGLLPSYIYLTADDLVPMLPSIHYETGIYLNFSAVAAQRPEVRALIDFLKHVVFDKRLPWFADAYESPRPAWREHLQRHLGNAIQNRALRQTHEPA